jgi:hypothetical protein
MTHYGRDPEDTHEAMHMYRHERSFRQHKLSRAVGHNKTQRAENARSRSEAKTPNQTNNLSDTGVLEQG